MYMKANKLSKSTTEQDCAATPLDEVKVARTLILFSSHVVLKELVIIFIMSISE